MRLSFCEESVSHYTLGCTCAVGYIGQSALVSFVVTVYYTMHTLFHNILNI